MRGKVFYMTLSAAELKALNDFCRIEKLPIPPSHARLRKRSGAIWFSATQHLPVKTIAKHLNVSQRSVWRWFKAYQENGINGLKGKSRHSAGSNSL